MVDQLRSGLAGQIGIATENEVALGTIVTPNTFIEFGSEAVEPTTTEVQREGISGTLFPRSGRIRTIFRGAMGPINDVTLWTTGVARLLRHMFGGYVFTWPGSTNAVGTLTLAAIPSNNDTMTIGSQVYTFKTALTASTTANEIKIAASIALQTSYIAAAIGRGVASDGQGAGEIYGSLTRLNPDVTAVGGATTVVVTDKQARGAGGNAVVTTETFTHASNVFGGATLASGVNGTDTARTHTYTIDGSKLRELALTCQVVRPPTETSRKAWTYSGCKIVSWTLALTADGALVLVPTIHARAEGLVTPIATAVYDADATFFDFTQCAFTIDGVEAAIQEFNLAAALGLATDRGQAGSSSMRNQLVTARPSITGSFGREFENMDLYNAWKAGTNGALVLTGTGPLIVGSASTHQVVLTLTEVRYQGAQPNVTGPEIVRKPIPFQVMDDGTLAPITLSYRSDEGYVGGNG